MVTKAQILHCLEQGHAAQEAFLAGLTARQRSDKGTYEWWSAKDAIAHMAYWQEHQAERVAALTSGLEPPAPRHFEEANAACFARFCECSFEKVQSYARTALEKLKEAVSQADESLLTSPPADAPGRALWLDVVGTGYTHTLQHMADFYTKLGQAERASRLWLEWGKVVTPLDDGPHWQSLTHYNIACGLALANSFDLAIAKLRQALRLKPSWLAWSRQDSDLSSLHSLPAFRELYAPEHWWKALQASPQAEAMADQFVRTTLMLREAIRAFPAEEWCKGETPYQRPAGLALHAIDAMLDCSVVKPGQARPDSPFHVSWEERDSSRLPSQEDLLKYLDQVEKALAQFLATADLSAPEEWLRWSGSTLLSRAAYFLRHTQHHLAELCLELHRRGIKAPEWQ
jgi:tetratricopeptide (TPR) repeat protein